MLIEERELRRMVIGKRDSVSGIFYVTVANKVGISKAIKNLVRAVRADERARCAKVAEGRNDACGKCVEEIVAAIREEK